MVRHEEGNPSESGCIYLNDSYVAAMKKNASDQADKKQISIETGSHVSQDGLRLTVDQG